MPVGGWVYTEGMAQEIVCTEHDCDVPVLDVEVHGAEIVFLGVCPKDGGHDIQVNE